MKKFITITLSLFTILGLSAQTEKGAVLLGAHSNLGFSSLSVTDYNDLDESDFLAGTITDIAISLNGSYFIVDNLALGLLINYSNSKLEVEGEDDSVSSLITYGLMARYYFGESGLWGQGSYSLGTLDEGTEDMDISGTGISLGYAWFVSDNVSINPSLGYFTSNTELDNDVMKMAGLSGSIGIAIHFLPKKNKSSLDNLNSNIGADLNFKDNKAAVKEDYFIPEKAKPGIYFNGNNCLIDKEISVTDVKIKCLNETGRAYDKYTVNKSELIFHQITYEWKITSELPNIDNDNPKGDSAGLYYNGTFCKIIEEMPDGYVKIKYLNETGRAYYKKVVLRSELVEIK
jgi:outer membrane protein